ncbi:MAG: phosphoribosyltransferase [Candidatus Tectomicrobia bacterium]|nr:phosphoribosyltransferase [Candidatus Tectomicrobia bacterium]
MADDLEVSWAEYHRKVEQLARIVRDSRIAPEQIICIAKGGLRVGDILARIFKLPLAILAAEAYTDRNDPRAPNRVVIAESLTSTRQPLGSRILLVDDLVDRGGTMQEAVAWLRRRAVTPPAEVWTAVIWYKRRSIFAPDFWVEVIEGDEPPWIVQPFERYEHLRPEDL